MKKLANVVMLPTEKASKITKEYLNDKDNLFYFPEPIIGKSGKNQHLYFITDEKIKEGDWVYNTVDKNITQILKNIRHLCKTDKKIIATTNESLEVVSKGINPVYEKLPRPSNEFLKAYCEVYNSNPITEVNIEYETNMDELPVFDGKYKFVRPERLKVAPDNTITISKVEERLYTRQEIEKLLFNYGKSIVNDINSISKVSDISIDKSHTKEWIKQNLK